MHQPQTKTTNKSFQNKTSSKSTNETNHHATQTSNKTVKQNKVNNH